MKIYSMTATFGKLSHETLTLQPGLNIIEAPNEWGKSTWCAFLVAMLYGIDTRERTKIGSIADKERYAPWSGEPMSGRMDINWEGRDITIERSTKGRVIFGEFRAFETATGLPVRELTAANCGLQLLGVEKEVFTRAGFLRLKDLPVSSDDTLRRRLNALVTTGDESTASDDLAQKLRDLKNKCRSNRTNGLLPQAEAQAAQLQSSLNSLQELRTQEKRTQERLTELEQRMRELNNHRTALKYEANRTYAEKLAAAQTARDAAAAALEAANARCADHPKQDEAIRVTTRLRQLRDSRDALHMDAQLLPAAPQAPEAPAPFRGASPDAALETAAQDTGRYDSLKHSVKKASPLMWILGLPVLALGLALLLVLEQPIPGWILIACGAVDAIAGLILQLTVTAKNRRIQAQLDQLTAKYGDIPQPQWNGAAQQYADAQRSFEAALEKYTHAHAELEQRRSDLQQQISDLCGSESLSEAEIRWAAVQNDYTALETAQREYKRAEELVQALTASHEDVPAPEFSDTLTYSEAETLHLISATAMEQKQMQLKLGNCQGQMTLLGEESHLRKQLSDVNRRIAKLETAYAALNLAQETLTQASQELQRRFAPKISRRAQALFGKLTDGRYDRLILDHDFSLSAGAKDEDNLRDAKFRSDGTIDQLYLALRLAVSEELTPDAPLILDDALVRFDDKRLKTAVDILQQSAESKQVILFTCQGREKEMMNS